MKSPPLFALGLIFAFGIPTWVWIGYALAVLGNQRPHPSLIAGRDPNPPPLSGMAERGQRVYAAQGCVYCHTQEIRSSLWTPDTQQNPSRPSIPQDYWWQHPIFLGNLRIGPDLTTLGQRYPNAQAMHQQLDLVHAKEYQHFSTQDAENLVAYLLSLAQSPSSSPVDE